MKVASEFSRIRYEPNLCILIGSRFFVTLSPMVGLLATNRWQNMTCRPKNSDKSLHVPDLIDRPVIGK